MTHDNQNLFKQDLIEKEKELKHGIILFFSKTKELAE